MRLARFFRRPEPPPPPPPAPEPPPPPPPDWRALGDAARDGRDWAGAVAHYRAHLDRHPDDAGIRVQLGHALKEAGDFAGAEAAYRDAAELRPEDHDPPLHLGHALKLQGRIAEAREAYRLSDALAPPNHAAAELEALGDAPPPHAAAPHPRAEAGPDLAALRAAFLARPERRPWRALREAGGDATAEGAPGGPWLLDVTDLLAMLRAVGRATGIQRVQLGLVEHLLDDGRCRFVALDGPLGPAWTLADADLRALLRYALAEGHDLARARALVEAALDRASWTHLPSARLFFVLGAFWYFAGATAFLDRLRDAGLRLGVLAYDTIPLTHPEHTDAATVGAFRQALAEGAQRWDLCLAISEHTARGMRDALGSAIPVAAMPLAHRFGAGDEARWPAALADLEGRDYVLSVGTIESRKNHLALFQAWKLLLAEGAEPPPLVLVGRPGWRVDDLLAQLEATGFLGGRIRLVHGISDPELLALYRGCLFSIFPSFTEGWGLPVGESLALGKPCLASTEGATPEAGEGFLDPIDPFNPRGIAARVRQVLDDRAALAATEARIRAGFRARGWAEVAADFVARIEAGLALPPAAHPAPAALPGPGQRFAGPALGAVLGPGFAPGSDGAAMADRTATLLLASDGPARALLDLSSRAGGRLAVSVGADAPRWQSLPPDAAARVPAALPGGPVAVTLHMPGAGRCVLHGVSLLPPGEARVPPRRLLRFGAGGDPLLWAPTLESGFDLAGHGAGVAVPGEAVLRLQVDAPALRLLLLLEGEGTVLHPGGEAPLAPALILPLAAPAGEIRLTLRPHGPLRLHALQWAAEDDLDGRLALLERAAPGDATLAERLLALEAPRPAAPLPGGVAGRLAQRLG